MNLAWSNLPPHQRSVLLKLASAEEGYAIEDAVGLQVTELTSDLLMAAGSLCLLGLVEQSQGWRGTWWLRLTRTARCLIAKSLQE